MATCTVAKGSTHSALAKTVTVQFQTFSFFTIAWCWSLQVRFGQVLHLLLICSSLRWGERRLICVRLILVLEILGILILIMHTLLPQFFWKPFRSLVRIFFRVVLVFLVELHFAADCEWLFILVSILKKWVEHRSKPTRANWSLNQF